MESCFFPSPGVVFFCCNNFGVCFFCRSCQKMLHVKVASHFFRQSSKVTLSNKKILQASPYHLPSDCFVGNLHKNWHAVNKKGLKRKTTTLDFAWPWLPRASMCLKHPRGFTRIAIFGGVVHLWD